MLPRACGPPPTQFMTTDRRQAYHPLLDGARAVIFDVGGTLVHPDWARLLPLSAELGHGFGADELQRGFCRELHQVDGYLRQNQDAPAYAKQPGWVFRRVYGALGLDESTCQNLMERADQLHEERHLWCQLDPHAPRVILALKAIGFRVAAISNTEDGRLEELLKLVEIAHHFDLLIDSHLVGLRKPDRAIFHLALERLGLAPHEAVYIGDSYGHDVLGAERAGLRALLIDPFDLYAGTNFPRISALSELISQLP
ncbi:MAG: HAD family hydrolase [Pyrinomonadaceae bacterium]